MSSFRLFHIIWSWITQNHVFRKKCTAVRNIEFISKQPCIWFVFSANRLTLFSPVNDQSLLLNCSFKYHCIFCWPRSEVCMILELLNHPISLFPVTCFELLLTWTPNNLEIIPLKKDRVIGIRLSFNTWFRDV